MNSYSSARDRLFFVHPDEIEQLVYCDDSDDEEENLQVDEEDHQFLEQETGGYQEDVVEVIIENGKIDCGEIKKHSQKRRASVLMLPDSEEISIQEVSSLPVLSPLLIPEEPVFKFRTATQFNDPKFIHPGPESEYDHSKIKVPQETDDREMPTVSELFETVCKFEGKLIANVCHFLYNNIILIFFRFMWCYCEAIPALRATRGSTICDRCAGAKSVFGSNNTHELN